MKSNIRSAATLLALGIALAQTTLAQVAMRIDLVAWGESIPGLTLKDRSGTPTTALSFRYSKSIPYNGPATMEIHQDPANRPTPAQGTPEALAELPPQLVARRKEKPTLAALVPLPSGSRHATILLAPAASGTFQAHVIDDDPSRLPPGKLRVHNLSAHEIALRFNEETATRLKPKQSAIVSPKDGQIVYELAFELDGEWITQENNLISIADNEQAQFVVLQSNASFFAGKGGSKSGFLQSVVLRRGTTEGPTLTELTAAEKKALEEEAIRRADEEAEKAKPKPGSNGR